MSFLMISRLIDFALMILQLFMLKVCAIIEVTNIDFFNYSRTERIKQNQKKKKKRKTIENILSLQDNHFLTNFNKSRTFLWFLTDNLTLSLPVTHCSNHNTSLLWNNNISKTVVIDIKGTFLKHKAIFLAECFLNVSLHFWFSSYWYLKLVELLESQKLICSIFSGLKG